MKEGFTQTDNGTGKVTALSLITDNKNTRSS